MILDILTVLKSPSKEFRSKIILLFFPSLVLLARFSRTRLHGYEIGVKRNKGVRGCSLAREKFRRIDEAAAPR